MPRTEVAVAARLRTPIDTVQNSPLAELGMVVSPWEADPEGLSAGPMFGYPADEVVIEELRRFAFALEWLTTSSLIRPTSPAMDCTMLSLIHDGFGEALENWADSEWTGPAAALVLLTGAQGDVFEWVRDDAEEYWPQFDGAGQDRIIVNLRWRNCRVTRPLPARRVRQLRLPGYPLRELLVRGCGVRQLPAGRGDVRRLRHRRTGGQRVGGRVRPGGPAVVPRLPGSTPRPGPR